jgi:hypothetical protein
MRLTPEAASGNAEAELYPRDRLVLRADDSLTLQWRSNGLTETERCAMRTSFRARDSLRPDDPA